MSKNIWDDDYSYLDDKDGQYYDDYFEKLKREEREYDDWLRTRHAEPGDPDYDEFDSLTSVEEYIEEHCGDLTRDEIRALKEEYGIFDDDDDNYDDDDDIDIVLARACQSKSSDSENPHTTMQRTSQTDSTQKIGSKVNQGIVAILCVIGAILLIWAIIDFKSLLSFVIIIAVVGIYISLFKPIFKR